MTPFRWQNCSADVSAFGHARTLRSYAADVIDPAIAVLETKIDALGRSDAPGDVFAQADMRDVLRETKMAFGLAIQSIWERQLRDYLSRCVADLRPEKALATAVQRGDWKTLCELFADLRGIRLDAFPSYEELETLHILGNACRHGNGPAAAKLAARCPEFWPTYPPLPRELPGAKMLSVGMMDVPAPRLQGFTTAIATFWDDATYIYNESIDPKHETLLAHLEQERARRTWLPQAVQPFDVRVD